MTFHYYEPFHFTQRRYLGWRRGEATARSHLGSGEDRAATAVISTRSRPGRQQTIDRSCSASSVPTTRAERLGSARRLHRSGPNEAERPVRLGLAVEGISRGTCRTSVDRRHAGASHIQSGHNGGGAGSGNSNPRPSVYKTSALPLSKPALKRLCVIARRRSSLRFERFQGSGLSAQKPGARAQRAAAYRRRSQEHPFGGH